MRFARAAAVEPGAPKKATPTEARGVGVDSAARAKGERAGSPDVARRPLGAATRPNHVGAGPVPAPRNAPITALSLPASLRARLIPVVGGRAVEMARLHDGPAASARARTHGARAVAEGEDVYFGEGEYRPGTC